MTSILSKVPHVNKTIDIYFVGKFLLVASSLWAALNVFKDLVWPAGCVWDLWYCAEDVVKHQTSNHVDQLVKTFIVVTRLTWLLSDHKTAAWCNKE